MRAEDFTNGHALKKWLNSRGVGGKIVARKMTIAEGTMLRGALDDRGKRPWWWFVGVERLQFERAEALLQNEPGCDDFEVRRENTKEEMGK